jgi:catechol 2,3-dioxygenase-like lactoylglutathione lyase family enzyme
MLHDKDAIATVAVKDLNVARRFYQDTLELPPSGHADEPGTLALRTGKSSVLVYESAYAGTNRATAVTWDVGGEVESTVQRLKSRGVVFEKYDLPGLTHKGDIHVGGNMKVAWFKDPDGNILSLVGH